MSNMQPTYKKDLYAWSLHNADLLRNKNFEEVDIENVAEEIESMGRSNRRELIQRFALLIANLLNQRLDIADLLAESPSLKHEIELQLYHAYEKAILLASEQTGMEEGAFPSQCPYTLAQCLDNQFFPE